MFRKHFNHLDDEYYKKDVPFYPWECITIQTIERDIYLIIKNEKVMEMLLKLLIYSIGTVDGNKGSSVKIEAALIDQLFKANKKRKYTYKNQINWIGKHRVMMYTLQKYRIMKIRMKISFTAFLKRMTVFELFATTILNSIQTLPKNVTQMPSSCIKRYFDRIMEGNLSSCFLALADISLKTTKNATKFLLDIV